jgi:phosphate transport system permease protein
MNVNPRANPMMSLPLATFEFVRSPQQSLIARGFATALVLMVLVMVLFTIARILGGRPAGRLTKRQARKAANDSAKDLRRIEAAGDAPSTTSAGDPPPPVLDDLVPTGVPS